jgi:hypothetical protein
MIMIFLNIYDHVLQFSAVSAWFFFTIFIATGDLLKVQEPNRKVLPPGKVRLVTPALSAGKFRRRENFPEEVTNKNYTLWL